MEAVREEVYRGCTISINIDEFPQDPRTDWDNVGTMVCFHSRYDLGDVQMKDLSFVEYINNEFAILDPEGYELDETETAKIEKWIDKNLILHELYLYDHGGITMRCSPFSCSWDSGQVGVIYVSKQKIKKEMGWKILTKARKTKAENLLISEVEIYDAYISGCVYGWAVESDYFDIADTCTGYYGYKEFEYMIKEARGIIDAGIKRIVSKTKKEIRIKKQLKNHLLDFIFGYPLLSF